MKKFRIKKGDKVIVVTGKCKGLSGEVNKVLTKCDRLIVTGINMVKCYKKPNKILEKELPIHISNVALIDPESQKPTRTGYKFLEDGLKVRFAKKSGAIV